MGRLTKTQQQLCPMLTTCHTVGSCLYPQSACATSQTAANDGREACRQCGAPVEVFTTTNADGDFMGRRSGCTVCEWVGPLSTCIAALGAPER